VDGIDLSPAMAPRLRGACHFHSHPVQWENGEGAAGAMNTVKQRQSIDLDPVRRNLNRSRRRR